MIYFTRKITIKDLNDCYKLDLKSLKLWNYKQWENELNNNNREVLGLFLKEIIIGICVYQVISEEAEIIYFNINPTLKRNGLGSSLFNSFLEKCKNKKIKKIFLEVSHKNYTALNFYKFLGFKATGIRKNYYRDGSDAVLQEKKC